MSKVVSIPEPFTHPYRDPMKNLDKHVKLLGRGCGVVNGVVALGPRDHRPQCQRTAVGFQKSATFFQESL